MEKRPVNGWLAVAVSALLFVCECSLADVLHVRVVDAEQQPVPDVAVFIQQQGGARLPAAPGRAVMDQHDKRFVPHMLVVQRGTDVSFPNSDTIAHHVYSFSRPNNFVLPLYKGTPPDPVTFEHDGIVTLGCNIHDAMLGYIVVVDTDIFGKTDKDGVVELPVDGDASAWKVSAWSPRLREDRAMLETVVHAGDALTATFVLENRLGPAHDENPESLSWNDYD